jgi:hypothetical protein
VLLSTLARRKAAEAAGVPTAWSCACARSTAPGQLSTPVTCQLQVLLPSVVISLPAAPLLLLLLLLLALPLRASDPAWP